MRTILVLFIALVGGGVLRMGCPGMQGMPGAPNAADQKMPPGILPPPGMESGGARTLMGATITPPEDSFLLIQYSLAESSAEASWQTCRRLSPLENCLLIEGLNYDGRDGDAPKDVNTLIPYNRLVSFTWQYELKPTPAPEADADEKVGEAENAEGEGS